MRRLWVVQGSRWRRAGAILSTVAVVAGVMVVGASPAEAFEWPSPVPQPETVSADAMPTVQIDGVVWAQEVVGNTVYVGGQFTAARPAGAAVGAASSVARSNFLAFDINTGQLRSDINFPANQQVRTLKASPDGSRLYVGGDFTSFGGQTRNRIAAINTSNNTLVSSFAPNVTYHVHAVDVTEDKVYIGGNFTSVSGQTRQRVAALNASNGAVLPFAPSVPDRPVNALVVSPDRTQVAIGGAFETLNGSTSFGRGFAVLDATSGATMPFASTSIIRNGGKDGAITALSTDGDLLYGSGYTFGRPAGTIEGVFASEWGSGTPRWVNDCHGDTYSVHAEGDVVYAAGHAHYCGNISGFGQPDGWDWLYYRGIATTKAPVGKVAKERLGYTSFEGQQRPELLNWFPSLNTGTFTGQYQGPWSVTGNSRYVVMGGEFTRVNGASQQGLVRFQRREFAANDQGPQLANASYPIKVQSFEAGAATVSWQANRDLDDAKLTYRVYRRPASGAGSTGNGTLLHTRTETAPFWNLRFMNWTDEGVAAGAYQYRVQVRDDYNNFANSSWTAHTVPGTGSVRSYLKAVLASQPDAFWRLGDSSGSTTAVDLVGNRNAIVPSGITFNQTGAISGDPDRAAQFSGAANVFARTPTIEQPPHTFTYETWLRTPSNANGGLIVGFNNRPDGAGHTSKHDRVLYMDNNGRLHFGVDASTPVTVSAQQNFRDNQWHHVVASLGPDGMKLSVDGQLRDQRSDVTNGRTGYLGYLRIGGGALDGFPNTATTDDARYFDGFLDDVAMYKRVLTPQEITSHYSIGKGQTPPPNQSPTAAVEVTSQSDLSVGVSGAGSSDPDGSIAGYSWDFGDGSPAVPGQTASKTYATAGTYTITLTVTDDDGATAQASTQVTVTASPSNQSPTAAIEVTSQSGLSVGVSGAGSSDPDGSIASYSWNFGDGSPAVPGQTASKTYTTAGTYPITLTVTDDDGATAQATTQVTVSAPPNQSLAADAFGRTVTNGFGTADVGGAWTVTGSASNYSVSGGSGKMRMTGPRSGRSAYLNGVSSTSSDMSVEVALDRAATGGGTYITLLGRRMANGDGYQMKVRYMAGGSVSVVLGRTVGGTETNLSSTVTVPGLNVAPGEALKFRIKVTGTSPTQLSGKVWKASEAEPGSWQVTGSDSTAALQSAGGVSLVTYLSGSATNAPHVASFDNLAVIPG